MGVILREQVVDLTLRSLQKPHGDKEAPFDLHVSRGRSLAVWYEYQVVSKYWDELVDVSTRCEHNIIQACLNVEPIEQEPVLLGHFVRGRHIVGDEYLARERDGQQD